MFLKYFVFEQYGSVKQGSAEAQIGVSVLKIPRNAVMRNVLVVVVEPDQMNAW